MDEDLEAFDVEDWNQNDIQDDIESVYPEEIEDKFYLEENNIEIFSSEIIEESDGKDEKQSFDYYLQNLERTELRLKDFRIKKLFKPRKTSPSKMKKPSPSNLKDTRLQRPTCFQTRSSNKLSIIMREIENSSKDYSIESTIVFHMIQMEK